MSQTIDISNYEFYKILKYQRFVPSGCKVIGIKKPEISARVQFLFSSLNTLNSPTVGSAGHEQLKKFKFCHKLIFCNPLISASQFFDVSNFTLSGFKDNCSTIWAKSSWFFSKIFCFKLNLLLHSSLNLIESLK